MAINGDFASVLGKYADKIEHATDVIELRRLQRESTRKAIRSTNVLRLEHDQSWPFTLEDHVEHFLRLAPKMRPEIEYFLKHAKNPTSTAAKFSAALNSFTEWLLERHSLQGKPPS